MHTQASILHSNWRTRSFWEWCHGRQLRSPLFVLCYYTMHLFKSPASISRTAITIRVLVALPDCARLLLAWGPLSICLDPILFFPPLLYKFSFTVRKWQNTLNKHPHTLHLSTHSLKKRWPDLFSAAFDSSTATLDLLGLTRFYSTGKPVGFWYAETALTHSYATKVQKKERDWNRAGSISGAAPFMPSWGTPASLKAKQPCLWVVPL